MATVRHLPMTLENDTLEEPVPEESPAPPAATTRRFAPTLDSTALSFGLFFLLALSAMAAAMLTVHNRPPEELIHDSGSLRSHTVISHWLNEGYFHYFGLINREADGEGIYRSSTGAYMVSGFIVEKIYATMTGRYSYRLLALHNQIVSALLSALAGLLSFRLARRFGLDARIAFPAGAAVVGVVFMFPDNLQLYWEMSAQVYGLIFALVYLLLEERHFGMESPPRALLYAQAGSVFVMTMMEAIFALGFIASVVFTTWLLQRGSWKRFVLVLIVPFIGAMAVYQLQLRAALMRFPDLPTKGSTILERTGFDGDARYYGDHLGIATRRDVARGNWERNREYLFRWKWVFILGVVSTLFVVIGFIRDRAPRIGLDILAPLIGAWLLYAAVFSQSVVIHPYLYDVLLFTPLCIALFAAAPALLESLNRRSGAIVLVMLFVAIWYSLFQLRLYSLRYPLPLPPP